ncbi:MotE family protein [Mangrovicella endophytica]|uniref:MotE family protein n=1 Tax=Mangrovicella endophytica TaxID=2066697 RepID=UPI000C9E436D|nr:MotE family protein [Mangrovicella endophytica]
MTMITRSRLVDLLGGAALAAALAVGAPAAFAQDAPGSAGIEAETAAPAVINENAAGAAQGPAKLAQPFDIKPQVLRRVGSDGTDATLAQPTEVESYCLNIADKVQDARYAAQTAQLKEIEGQIDQKIAELEAKRQDFQRWLEERQKFLDAASPIVIDIYAKMKPDAAAAQLAGLDQATAASVLAKLKTRTASSILAEMPAKAAADLAALIVAKTTDPDAPIAAPKDGQQS